MTMPVYVCLLLIFTDVINYFTSLVFAFVRNNFAGVVLRCL